MRRPSSHLAIVLATSTLSLSLLGSLVGCDGDVASRADQRVNKQIQSAYGSENTLDALKQAAGEDDASPATRARAKALLADAELQAGTALMRRVDQNENRIAMLVWEIGQLGQSIQTSSKLIDAYRSYDPAVVQKAAEGRVAEAQGKNLVIKSGDANVANLPALATVAGNVSSLQAEIKKRQGELEQLTAQRTQLLQQAEEATRQSDAAKGREAVDIYAKASDLRRQAAEVAGRIDGVNSAIARLNADLAVQQQQQQVLSGLVKDYQQDAAATAKGFKAVGSQEEALRRLIQDIYGGAGAAPATNPAAAPSTIRARAAELARIVEETTQLRSQAVENINSAVQHYDEARAAAEDFHRELQQLMGAPGADQAPQRIAWEDLRKTISPSGYQLQRATALQTLGALHANHAESLASRVQLAQELAKTLQAANLQLPDELAAKDAAAQLKEAHENADKAYADADDLIRNVIEAPLASESQKEAARVAQILTLYSWSNAQNAAGKTAEAKKHRAEIAALVKGAVEDNITLPALPADIAPAPKIATTAPAGAAAPTTAPKAAPAPKTAPAPAPAPEQ